VKVFPRSISYAQMVKARQDRPLLIIVLILFISLLASRAHAAVHPVPLEKNADASTCLTCHENKSKGKFTHSAIAMGCLSCHEVRVNKDVTRVKLITATPYKLCFSCHADKDATQIKGHVHEPAVRDCLKCHDPHTSDNKFQLLKASAGDKKDNLCLTCHTQGLNVPDKGSRHAALDMGCETCHLTHKTGAEPTPENRFHLTKAAPALCVDCHDPKDAALQKSHQNQPFGTANCLQCHDPHQSAAPKLMAKFVHSPSPTNRATPATLLRKMAKWC
jgi:Doubled CXXCH motif (Paired_CXXCH_1).